MQVTKIVKQQINRLRAELGDTPLPATAVLEGQHRAVEALFARIKRDKDGRDKRALLVQLADQLAAHMAIEQEIFYPTCARETNQEPMLFESWEEHAVARFELERLLATSVTDPSFDAKVTVLEELIKHHVEEEEDQLFKKATRQMGADRLRTLGGVLQQRFDELQHEGFRELLSVAMASALRRGDGAGQRTAAKKPARARRAKRGSTSRQRSA